MSDSEPEIPAAPKEKRKVNEKQMAGLRKGMEIIKAKREALAKEREAHEEKKSKGEIPADAPKPKLTFEKKPKVVVVSAPPAEPQVILKERKKQVRKTTIAVDEVKGELASLRAELSALKKPAEIVVKEVEKPVERIVEKTKVLSGSELLNSIFFK